MTRTNEVEAPARRTCQLSITEDTYLAIGAFAGGMDLHRGEAVDVLVAAGLDALEGGNS